MQLSTRLRSALALVAAAALGAGTPLAAQETGTLRGTVTEAATGRPLAGAQVVIVGTTRRAATDQSGQYSLTNAPAGALRVRAEMIGHQGAERSVTVVAGQTAQANFALAQSVLELDALVVTGTAGATQKRSLGNAITSVNAAQVTDRAPVNTVTQLMQGRAPGLTIMQPSGSPGTASNFRIRGTGSYQAGNQPIVLIDGIRMNAGSQGGFNVGGQSTSALDALNPDDIESIEIIRGPAAATLYGAEAASGVIQVITKKGKVGEQNMKFDAKVEYGQSDWARKIPASYALCTPARIGHQLWPGCSGLDPSLPDEQRVISATPLRDPGVLRKGDVRSYTLSARGGGESYSFYLSGDNELDEGVYVNSYFKRTSGRANFFVTPSKKFDLAVSTGYTLGHTRLPTNDNAINGWGMSGLMGRPGYFVQGATWAQGWNSLGPEQLATYDNVTRAERAQFAVTANYQPLSWFRNRVTAGLDANTRRSTLFYGKDQTGRSPWGSTNALGYISHFEPKTRNWTLDYAGTISNELPREISSDLSFGMQLNAYRFESLQGVGEGLTKDDVRLISTANVTRAFEQFSEQNSLGFFVQEQIGWKNRLFVTAALRSDDNSSFGAEFNQVLYPKASVAYVISEEDFFRLPGLDQLKLRAAWGQAGNAPSPFSSDRTYAVSNVLLANEAVAGAIRTSAFGNPNLKAETGDELELGFDASLLGDRIVLEATYYNKTTKDALLSVPVAPSSGYVGNRLINAGEINNRGVELSMTATPVQSRRVNWETLVSVATNSNEFVSFGGTRDEPILFGYIGAAQWHAEGYPMGSYWANMPLRNDDGSLQLNAQGRPVLDTARTYIGPSTPTREAAFTNTLTLFNKLTLYAFMDYKGGHYLQNITDYYRYAQGVSWEAVNPNGDPEDKLLRGWGGNSPWIQKADFVKLREVSASFSLPKQVAGRIGTDDLSVSLAGRNLATWTKYPGSLGEPETNINGADTFTRADFAGLPALRKFVVTVNARF